VILVSDNESWVGGGRHGSTGVMAAWEDFVRIQRKLDKKKSNPKLVCIDLQPNQTTQASERSDIMNIGGFSDSVFNVVSAFLADNNQRFVAEVDAVEL
jgi:60 kDa SS-A/Ro ribonucleoprotein